MTITLHGTPLGDGTYGFRCPHCGWERRLATETWTHPCPPGRQQVQQATSPPRGPSPTRRLANFTVAAIAHLVHGMPTCTQDEIERRLAICRACPLFNGQIGELFKLKCDLLLYDITSTYFEGDMEGCAIAQRGYSRDSRGDRPQVCIGLVVTEEGFPLGYEVYAGNTHDSTTVQTIIEALEKKYGTLNHVWVMGHG